MVLINPVEGLDEDFHGLAHLIAKLVGDFLLVRGALGEQQFQGVGVGDAVEASDAEQRAEGTQRDRLIEPERGIPRAESSGLTGLGVDEHPAFAVGEQAEANAGAAQQFGHARSGRRLPAMVFEWLVEILGGGNDLNQKTRMV